MGHCTALVLETGQVVAACAQCAEAIRREGIDADCLPLDVAPQLRRRAQYRDGD
jgi:hypothetical protein